MNNFFAISFCFVYFLFSCNKFSGENSISKISCDSKSLTKDIQENWKFNDSLDYIMTNDSFLKKLNLKYHDCLIGTDTSEINKYFGNHFKTGQIKKNDSIATFHQYTISPPLSTFKKLGSFNWSLFYFYFSKDYKLVSIKKEIMTVYIEE